MAKPHYRLIRAKNIKCFDMLLVGDEEHVVYYNGMYPNNTRRIYYYTHNKMKFDFLVMEPESYLFVRVKND